MELRDIKELMKILKKEEMAEMKVKYGKIKLVLTNSEVSSKEIPQNETKKIEDFLNFLLPEDVEEIVSLYLQLEKNYLIYTSTNKIDTAKYEFVMISRDGKEKCCIQVKTGNITLNPEDYINLTENNDKVYLFTLGKYKRENINNVICLKKEEILDFIKNNKEILPSGIKYWMEEVEKN